MAALWRDITGQSALVNGRNVCYLHAIAGLCRVNKRNRSYLKAISIYMRAASAYKSEKLVLS